MSGLINEVPLNTFLTTATGGAPSITARALVNTLSPISYNYSDDPPGAPPHYGFDWTDINTLAATQSKYNPLMNLSDSTPEGIRPYDLVTVTLQAVKDISAAVPVIPNGPGLISENGSGTFFARTLQAGQNIALTIPDGSTGNPTIAFTPAGQRYNIGSTYNSIRRSFGFADDAMVWNGSQWQTQSFKNIADVVNVDDVLVGGCIFSGNPTQNWDQNGLNFIGASGGWGNAPSPYKPLSWNETRETNSNPVVAGNNQGLADPKNVLHAYKQTGNSTGFTPSLALAGHLYKAFSLISDTGGLTGDFTGEVAYLRGDGTFTGRAFNVVSHSAVKKEVEDLSLFLEDSKTSALDLVSMVQPISFRYSDESQGEKKHFGFLVDQIHRASGAQEELKSLIGYQGESGEPQALHVAETLALLFQALKDLHSEFDSYRKTHP